MAARAGDVRTYHNNNTYIQTEFAHTITIYVGLAQARPNKVERDVPSADVGLLHLACHTSDSKLRLVTVYNSVRTCFFFIVADPTL